MTKTEAREQSIKNSIDNLEVKKSSFKRIALKTDKNDFSDTLEVTRTLFKNKISKTSIVESALACAANSSESMTVKQIANYIVKSLNVKDCFHKRESNKSNNIMQSTTLRVKHHIKDTIKNHHKADTLYSYIDDSDSILFTEKYQKLCKTSKIYRKHISEFLKRVKLQYNAPKRVSKKAVKKTA